MEQFDFTYWFGPKEKYGLMPETIKNIVDCGFTLGQLWHSVEGNQKALALLKEFGLRTTLVDPRTRPLVRNNDFDAVDTVVKQIVEDYKGHDNLIGIDVYDEPAVDKFAILAKVEEAFKKYAPEWEATINLFPTYAGPGVGFPTYREYVENFIQTVKPTVISYDHYHFVKGENNETVARYGFFENLEDIRDISYKHNIDPMFITLLVEHGAYSYLSRAELLWEVNMGLAYGMRRISFFTYWLPLGEDADTVYTNAMCDEFGNLQPHWYDAQAVMKETRAMGEYLFDRRTVEVFHVGESEKETRQFVPFGGIKSVDGDELVIGFFDDGSIYLVNRRFKESNTVALQSEKGLEIWKDGKFVPYGDGQKIELPAGAAVLLKSL